jgi:large subunit ribosomal protein L25
MELRIAKREELGTRRCRRLREQGLVPGIIYGHGEENLCVSVRAHDIEGAISHGERLLRAEVDRKQENLLIKAVQYDHLGNRVIHVDLTRVSLDERVEVTVPIVLRGTPVGVESEDGVLTQRLNEVEIECLVTAIPEELRVQVAGLHVGDALRVADLELPDGVTASEDGETVVVSVAVMAEEEAPAEEIEEAAVEPEVIGEEAEEEPAAEGDAPAPRRD